MSTNQTAHNIKSMQINQPRKRQNLIIKNKLKGKELVSLNININKIINKKEKTAIKGRDKITSTAFDSINNYKTNSKNDNMKLDIKEETNDIKKKKNDSDIGDINSNKISQIKSHNITITNANKKNKENRLIQKTIKIFDNSKKLNNEKNTDNIYNKSTVINIKNTKAKISTSNLSGNKININNILKHDFNTNNFSKINNTNTKIKNNYSKDINYKSNKTNNIKAKNYLNENNLKNEKITNAKSKTYGLKKNKEELFSKNKTDINLNQNKKNENDIINKQNLCLVKKSLFSEHMNFFMNYKDEKMLNKEKVGFENNFFDNYNQNYINNPLNSIFQSTENKEFESKFINYDLGKTTGISQTKESLIVFANEEPSQNAETSKEKNLMNHQNFFEDEKERTTAEIEKLAEHYLNISKNKVYENKEYKKDNSQTNTITTIIDNNFNEESI